MEVPRAQPVALLWLPNPLPSSHGEIRSYILLGKDISYQELMSGEAAKERVTPVPSKS